MNDYKEEIKLKIQKSFTKLRNIINEREDELLLDVDKKFDEIFINEQNLKKSEKLPSIVEKLLEKGKKINEHLINNNLIYYINDCINIENNINEIKRINETLKNSNIMNLKINFIVEEDEINKILKSIKELGKLKNDYDFDTKIDFDRDLIRKWLNNKSFVPELLFRKTRDGSTPKDFHDKCDNKGITIVFIETTKGYKFGGYT